MLASQLHSTERYARPTGPSRIQFSATVSENPKPVPPPPSPIGFLTKNHDYEEYTYRNNPVSFSNIADSKDDIMTPLKPTVVFGGEKLLSFHSQNIRLLFSLLANA